MHREAARFNTHAANDSSPIAYAHQDSIDFNNGWNLVRDQEVGGSNPLASTNLFKALISHSCFVTRYGSRDFTAKKIEPK